MRIKLTILFLLICGPLFAQQSVTYKQVKTDTLRVRNLAAQPSAVTLYGTVYGYNDSVWFVDQSGTHYNLLNWLDSLVVHDGHYYSLRDSVRAIVSGDDYIANNTYFTSRDVLGNLINLWKVDQNKNFIIAPDQLLKSQNSEFDAGMLWRNIPLRNALYGDSVGFRNRVNGYELSKSYMIADGTGGPAKRKTEFRGNVYAQDSLYVANQLLNPEYFTREIATDAENNIAVGFTLTAKTKVFYNGYIIPQTRWTGVGTRTIALTLDTRKYDVLQITN